MLLVYYAIVDCNGDYQLDWTPNPTPIVQYLYHHHDVKLLICHESPNAQDDCSIVATIEPQVTIEAIGLTPVQGVDASRLIALLDTLFGTQLDAAHAKRLAYLSGYLAQLKHLPPRDTDLLILAAYLHDFDVMHFDRLHATLAAVLKRVGQPWTKSDTERLITVLTAPHATGWAKRLQNWTTEIRELDTLRFGRPVDIALLHDHDIMRLLYASYQEFNLISDHQSKEH